MTTRGTDYEIMLAEYSNAEQVIDLLRQYRPYLEQLPSLRRPHESLVTIPLPTIRLRPSGDMTPVSSSAIRHLPSDLAILMCDPEWKIKVGVEILLFIYRSGETFSELLGRWRETQVLLSQSYEWLMPFGKEHMFSEVAEQICPLFVLSPETPKRIGRGLIGAGLPFVSPELTSLPTHNDEEILQIQD
ncbi:MAG: hypothetical protein AAGG02_09585 [Cyanobacteria bacterium P01_H01_bin.15]